MNDEKSYVRTTTSCKDELSKFFGYTNPTEFEISDENCQKFLAIKNNHISADENDDIIINNKHHDSQFYFYLGKYFYRMGIYYKRRNNFKKMKKYYLKAIELGESDAMFALGFYYNERLKYEKMKKYYLLAIQYGHSNAMNILAQYYQYIETNYDLMKRYYLMAINLGDFVAMRNLARHYYERIGDREQAKYYFLLAAASAPEYLREYYYKSLENFYEKSCIEDIVNLFAENVNLKNEIIELRYAPGGVDYMQAKQRIDEMSNADQNNNLKKRKRDN